MFIRVLAVLFYGLMVFVNFLANSLPINGRSTGDISDAYPNLFAPAGITFSIWGLIYLSLAAYLVYQFFLLRKGGVRDLLIRKINVLFIATSIANILWIFAWHYDFIGLSVFIMLALLVFLIKIADILNKEKMSSIENLFILAPFSLYFGWITVAAIANFTVFLVSINWDGFGISGYIWTSLILFIGMVIGILRTLKDNNPFYVAVLIWAYSGILFKHISSSGFNGQYPLVITSAVVCLLALLASLFFVIINKDGGMSLNKLKK